MARTGRRRGPSTTREAILHAARARFAGAGYEGTSLRTIAADAGVDPGMVLHFFGTKEALFRAVVSWPFNPVSVAPHIVGQGVEGIGGRVARAFFGFWEDPDAGAALLALLRSAMTNEASAALLREFTVRHLFAHVTGLLRGPQAELRVALAASQLIGVAMLRYALRIEPIASAGIDELVTWVTPTLTRYLEAEG